MTAKTTKHFWAKVNRKSDTECWEWIAGKTPDGYGSFWTGEYCCAHRFAYELFRGPIPSEMTIDHLCRNPGCVNPYHMEIVTNRINILRGTGLAAQNSRKTHCVHGHPFSGDNLIVCPKRRDCRECRRERSRKAKLKKRASRRVDAALNALTAQPEAMAERQSLRAVRP